MFSQLDLDPNKRDLISVGVLISKGCQGFETVMLCKPSSHNSLATVSFPWDTCRKQAFLLLLGKKAMGLEGPL